MNVRNEWLNSDTSSSSQFYTAEETINEAKENFDIRRYYSAEGADVIVDNVTCRALVQYFSNPLNKVKYDRELHVPMDINIHTGSLIEYKNNKWLVTSSIDDLQAYKSAGIVETNNTLTLNKNNTLTSIPCIVSSNISVNTTLSADENKYLESLSNEAFIRVPANSDTNQININDKFKIGRFSYKVESISDIIEVGLLLLKVCFIADEVILPTYSLSILNGSNIQLNENDSLTLNIQVKADDTIVSPTPQLTFSSSNPLIATISSAGVVSILDVGTVNFTCKLSSDITISDTIEVEIISTPVENKTVNITGSTSLIKNYTENYSCIFKNNGIVYSDTSVFYLTSDDGISATSLAIITTQNGVLNTCTIKGLGLGYVKLFVKNVGETVVSTGLRIKVENLF
jgi:hypothetical protein